MRTAARTRGLAISRIWALAAPMMVARGAQTGAATVGVWMRGSWTLRWVMAARVMAARVTLS